MFPDSGRVPKGGVFSGTACQLLFTLTFLYPGQPGARVARCRPKAAGWEFRSIHRQEFCSIICMFNLPLLLLFSDRCMQSHFCRNLHGAEQGLDFDERNNCQDFLSLPTPVPPLPNVSFKKGILSNGYRDISSVKIFWIFVSLHDSRTVLWFIFHIHTEALKLCFSIHENNTS